MNHSKLITLFILLLSSSLLKATVLEDFIYTQERIQSYKFSGDNIKLLSATRDSDGNVFTLVKSNRSKVNYSNDAHQNYSESISKSTESIEYILSKFDVQQRLVWSDKLKTEVENALTFSQLTLSPQGNIALTFSFNEKLTGPNGKSWTPKQRDALFLFLKNSDGSLLKDIQISGNKNEYSPKVIFGTGGEVYLHAVSTSPQVTYLNEKYAFKLHSIENLEKDILISLKPSFYTQWSRSIEPAAFNQGVTYKDSLLAASLSFSKSFGIYKKNGFIKSYSKPINTPSRSVVFAFKKDGFKQWDKVIYHEINSSVVTGIKSYPNGNIGVHGQYVKQIKIGDNVTIYEIPLSSSKKGLSYFSVSLDHTGKVINRINFNSKAPLTLYSNGDNHTLASYTPRPKKEDAKLYYRPGAGRGVNTIPQGNMEGRKKYFVLNQDLEPIYNQVDGSSSTSSFHWFRLSEGRIKSLTGGNLLTYSEAPYGKEDVNDEEIPGLAFKPRFYHGDDSQKYKATLSYAIPPDSTSAIIYYPPRGMSQIEYLSNSLVQATLNLTYFRGFSVIVMTSEDALDSEVIQYYFSPLSQKEYFKELKEWHVVGYEDRFKDLLKIYNREMNFQYEAFEDILSMAFYYPEIEEESVATEAAIAKLAAKLPPSFMVTSHLTPKLRKRIRKVQKTFIEYGRDLSHIHFNGAPINKGTFSAVNSYGEEKSIKVYEQLVNAECLDEKDYLKNDPTEKTFISDCLRDGLPLTGQDKTTSEATQDLIQHLAIHYGHTGHTPYVDQEYFEFIEYVKANQLVAKKKQGGDLNSVLK